jgi:kynurenine formamidase
MKWNDTEQWIDLSHLVKHDMPVWDGDPVVTLNPVANLANDGYCNYEYHTGLHAGTHVDGVLHMISDGDKISCIPIHQLVGQGVLLNMNTTIKQQLEDIDDMPLVGKIVLLHYGHDKYWGQTSYFSDYPELDPELAHLLVKKQVKMIGMDTPSPDRSPYLLHRLFLENGILLIENLTGLSQLINAKKFDVLAFPLKMDADSSPARVVARLMN